jgi:predicted nucleic acid-binding protein
MKPSAVAACTRIAGKGKVRILIDTNSLLRAIQASHPVSSIARVALRSLHRQNYLMFLTLQNIAEFWNVCTRPQSANGLGLTIEATDRHLSRLQRFFILLPESEQVIQHGRRLVVVNSVKGVQVHDARLAAFMEAYAIPQILTFNTKDFARFSHVDALHPQKFD